MQGKEKPEKYSLKDLILFRKVLVLFRKVLILFPKARILFRLYNGRFLLHFVLK